MTTIATPACLEKAVTDALHKLHQPTDLKVKFIKGSKGLDYGYMEVKAVHLPNKLRKELLEIQMGKSVPQEMKDVQAAGIEKTRISLRGGIWRLWLLRHAENN